MNYTGFSVTHFLKFTLGSEVLQAVWSPPLFESVTSVKMFVHWVCPGNGLVSEETLVPGILSRLLLVWSCLPALRDPPEDF